MSSNSGNRWIVSALVVALAFGAACKSPQADSSIEETSQPQANATPPSNVAVVDLLPDRARAAATSNQPKQVTYVIPAGSTLQVRLQQTVATDTHSPGDRFTGSLDAPVSVNGEAVLPAGSRVHGILTSASSSGRVKGRAVLGLAVDSIEWAGKTFPLQTNAYVRSKVTGKVRLPAETLVSFRTRQSYTVTVTTSTPNPS